jgi:hypothetical protein
VPSSKNNNGFDYLQKLRLQSTSEDITKRLGNSVDNRKESYLWNYDFPEGRMSIFYQTSQCVSPAENNGKSVGWKVPEWTVVEVDFSFEKRIKPKKLNIDFKGFTANPIYDVPEAFEYTNAERGIDYGVYKGEIEGVIFRPAKNLDYLKCK